MTAQRPHRRKAGLRRPGRRRDGNPRVLILCEGAKTEPNYFRGLKTAQRLTSVAVRPPRAGQPGPRGLWERVRGELRNDPGWDEVYCVLDHDGRDGAIGDLEGRLSALNRRTSSPRVEMILSNPCFEYWLLLHFEFTDRPFRGNGNQRTACEEVTVRLRGHLPDYRKNDPRIFERCREHLDDAVRNARRADSGASSSSSRTDVWKLIGRLLEIGRRSNDARGRAT